MWPPMKDKYATQIKALKAAAGFKVKGESERVKALRTAAGLKRFGVIEFEVASRNLGKDEFLIFAGKA